MYNLLFFISISCLFLLDMFPIARRYLNNDKGERRDYEHWVNKKEKIMPLIASSADRSILN